MLTSREPAAVPRGDLTTTVELAPLDEPARLELVAALGGDDLDVEVVRQLVERSDGIPLFAGELVRAPSSGGLAAAELTFARRPATDRTSTAASPTCSTSRSSPG